ncbi:AbrB/MazE/SpoVT family DNA-binding domain-containing protein [Sporolactobacillus sp. THM7-7]|nr:AbrB/MazE/SpoVT family DNA-binding domain-containing protein [Sporolactobacillus sp. THM7-7]
MESAAMERKIFKMGNSLGSTYPKEVLEHLNVKPGDEIVFENLSDGTVKIRKRKAAILPDGIDPEFIDMVDQIIKDNDAVFRGLVNR